ncbi:MAG: hypothetical protein OSB46_10125 [Alphaproteobacteria bacterium]|nr:hypothetical protein [Alphaproteobacteria bacterium]
MARRNIFAIALDVNHSRATPPPIKSMQQKNLHGEENENQRLVRAYCRMAARIPKGVLLVGLAGNRNFHKHLVQHNRHLHH